MHRAHLSFNQSEWHATFNNGSRVSDHVLGSLLRKVWAYVDEQWGPYERPVVEVDVLVAPHKTPMAVAHRRTLVTSIYDPWSADAPYETVVLVDEETHTTELHQVTYGHEGASSTDLRLSIDDIVKLVPALSIAGGRMSFNRASEAMLEDEDARLTPDSLAIAMEAWPPPLWKRIGFVK